MILAVDIGNSRIKSAVLDGTTVAGRETFDTARRDVAAILDGMLRRVSDAPRVLDDVWVSSVVPAVTVGVTRAIRRQTGISPQLVDHRSRLPFLLSGDAPASIGADRLCAAAGAVGTRRRNAVVIDAGSAVTVDIVRHGVFLGGAITIGPALALRALGQYASRLPHIDFANAVNLYPRRFDGTEAAMTLGAGAGSVGAIREAVRHIEATVGVSPPKFITGGAAPALLAHLPRSWHHDPDLVLKGLYTVSALNRRRTS